MGFFLRFLIYTSASSICEMGILLPSIAKREKNFTISIYFTCAFRGNNSSGKNIEKMRTYYVCLKRDKRRRVWERKNLQIISELNRKRENVLCWRGRDMSFQDQDGIDVDQMVEDLRQLVRNEGVELSGKVARFGGCKMTGRV